MAWEHLCILGFQLQLLSTSAAAASTAPMVNDKTIDSNEIRTRDRQVSSGKRVISPLRHRVPILWALQEYSFKNVDLQILEEKVIPKYA